MDTIMLTLQDWLALTTALMAAMSPAYVLLWQMKGHMSGLKSIIAACPYCRRSHVEIKEVDEDVL